MDKIVNVLKSSKFQIFLLFLIALLALFLRFIGLDKVGGFWYDEAASYFSATQSFPFGIIHRCLTADLHPPLYFLFLHLWIKLLGNADFLIRLSSLTFGVLTVPVMYLAGREIDSRKTGILAALFTAISSVLIYYSQEVRVYPMLVLLTALSVLFLVKVDKKPCRKNYAGLVAANSAILYTASLGFVFVFFQALSYLIYIFFKDKSKLKGYVISQLITVLIALPFILALLNYQAALSRSFVSSFDWARFTWFCPVYILQDWFSPFLINILNHPHGFYENIFSTGITPFSFIFIIFPVLVYITGIFKSLSVKNVALPLFASAILFFIFEIFAASAGKITLISRYTIQAVPVMILLASYGWSKINNKIIKRGILGFFVLSSLFFVTLSPYAPQRLPRPETIKSVAINLYKLNLNEKDIVAMPLGSKFLGKYYNKKVQLFDFDIVETFQGAKRSSLVHVFDPELLKELTRENAYPKLNSYLSSPAPSRELEAYVNSYLEKLEKGRYFVLVVSRGIAIYSNNDLKEITGVDQLYKNQSMMFMLSSKSQNDIAKIASEKLSTVNVIQDGVWEIHVFQKNKF